MRRNLIIDAISFLSCCFLDFLLAHFLTEVRKMLLIMISRTAEWKGDIFDWTGHGMAPTDQLRRFLHCESQNHANHMRTTMIWKVPNGQSLSTLPTTLPTTQRQWGCAHYVTGYPKFTGSHFGLPTSSIHRMTRLGGNFMWTMTYLHRPHITTTQSYIALKFSQFLRN